MWLVQVVADTPYADCSGAPPALQRAAPVQQQLVLSLGAEPCGQWTAEPPVPFAQPVCCPPALPQCWVKLTALPLDQIEMWLCTSRLSSPWQACDFCCTSILVATS